MRKISFVALIVLIIAGNQVSAQSKTADVKAKSTKSAVASVPFTVAENYFVQNAYVAGSLKNPKITSESQFNAIFGAASYMGNSGKPTAIDFSKQYVIAVIPPATNQENSIKAVSLTQSGKNITLKYSYKLGAKQTFTSQPFLLLVVDAKYAGTVKAVKA